MKEQFISKKDLHVRVDPEVYNKLKHVTFYERETLSNVVNRALVEYLEERALEETELVAPPVL
jgi:predicted transcriptional regulator